MLQVYSMFIKLLKNYDAIINLFKTNIATLFL